MAMIENSSNGFISIDKYGDFEIMNQTARSMLDVTHTSNLKRLKNNHPELAQLLEDINPGDVNSCQITNNGQIGILQVSCSLLRFRDKDLTLISLLDIKKEIEARELKSWQKLIRIMNHEIMNSIAPIISVSKSLQPIFLKDGNPVMKNDLEEKGIHDTINGLEVIESMSTGLKSFVGHYRKLSNIPKPVLKPIFLDKWTEYLKVLCTEVLRNNNALLDISCKSKNNVLVADEGLLNQVILNLVKNADEAPNRENSEKIITINIELVKQKLYIIIKNNGAPIPKGIRDQIFVPFFTTKNNGAGIGLFISRQIISLHHGSLTAYTDEHDETVFKIEL
jgi:nitrogen fixation/metabolism regulation signal transduction histidine kinase